MTTTEKKLKTPNPEGTPKAPATKFNDLMPSGQKIFKNQFPTQKKAAPVSEGKYDHSNKKDWKAQNDGYKKFNNTYTPRDPHTGEQQSRSCFKCNLEGHIAKDCPTSKRHLGKRPPTYNKDGQNAGGYNNRSPGQNGYTKKPYRPYSAEDSENLNVNSYEFKKGEKTQLYTLASKVSSKDVKSEEKIASITEVLNLIGDNFEKFVGKKAGSRLIQGCLKHGNKEQKAEIFGKLKGTNM